METNCEIGSRRSPRNSPLVIPFTSDALEEIDAFFRKSGKIIIPLTVHEILNEQIARKLA